MGTLERSLRWWRVVTGGVTGFFFDGLAIPSSLAPFAPDRGAIDSIASTDVDDIPNAKNYVAAALDEAMAMAILAPKDAPLTFVAREGWHPGVVGIVAGRLKDAFFRPSLVGAIEGDVVKCSLRSIEGIDIGGVIARLKDEGLALSGGGHAMAAGLSFSRAQMAAVEARMRELVTPLKAAAPDARAYAVDAVMHPAGINMEFVEMIGRAAPFGQGNPEPVFVLADVTVSSAARVGTGHVSAELSASGSRIRGIASARVKETDRVHATCTELARLGVQVEEHEDGMTIHPTFNLQPANIQTYNDHRMAMAFSLIGLRFDGVTIENPSCVSKTFPNFFEVLAQLQVEGSKLES